MTALVDPHEVIETISEHGAELYLNFRSDTFYLTASPETPVDELIELLEYANSYGLELIPEDEDEPVDFEDGTTRIYFRYI